MYNEVEEMYVAAVQKVCLAREFAELISWNTSALKSLSRFNSVAKSWQISIQNTGCNC